jgi:hypothetical protein
MKNFFTKNIRFSDATDISNLIFRYSLTISEIQSFFGKNAVPISREDYVLATLQVLTILAVYEGGKYLLHRGLNYIGNRLDRWADSYSTPTTIRSD